MVEFPSVSKSFTVINSGTGALRVHFQSGSGTAAITFPGISGAQDISSTCDVIAGLHFITVDAASSLTMDVKCKKFYLSGDRDADTPSYEVFAELTNIPTSRMYPLTGSGIT